MLISNFEDKEYNVENIIHLIIIIHTYKILIQVYQVNSYTIFIYICYWF